MVSVTLKGVLVAVHGVGVLIRGPSGSGKSMAALGLISRGHKLVSDDVVKVSSDCNGTLLGRPLEEKVRIELRGIGVFYADSLVEGATVASSPIDFIVDLDTYDPEIDTGRISPETGWLKLLEREVPTVRVPLTSRADPALLIEMLAWHFKKTGTVKSQ